MRLKTFLKNTISIAAGHRSQLSLLSFATTERRAVTLRQFCIEDVIKNEFL